MLALMLMLTASAQEPGSIWQPGQPWLLDGQDGTTRAVGDLITVIIVESSSSSLSADTSANRDATNSAGVTSLFGLRERFLSRRQAV